MRDQKKKRVFGAAKDIDQKAGASSSDSQKQTSSGEAELSHPVTHAYRGQDFKIYDCRHRRNVSLATKDTKFRIFEDEGDKEIFCSRLHVNAQHSWPVRTWGRAAGGHIPPPAKR